MSKPLPVPFTTDDIEGLPVNICTWGLLTDNPCLISFKLLRHTHRDRDPRPYVYVDGKPSTTTLLNQVPEAESHQDQ